MVTVFDLPCSQYGGEVIPVNVPVNEYLEDESEMIRLGECAECGSQHYPEQAFDAISG